MKTLFVNGREVAFDNEKNLLEVIRKANIEIPTFCYHSELSVYGACRLCMVDIEGRGLITSCSTKPEEGMKVKTHTSELREMRKIILELLLANHDRDCTSCQKNANCKLQDLAYKLGVDKIRFKKTEKILPIDYSSKALVRDPNKCILCGDCVRACSEIQGIGAIDFAHRGSFIQVTPAFGKDLAMVECVDCGQCARVCPTGSITPRSEIDIVWADIDNPNKKVVAQIAPAVRVAIGEMFGLQPGDVLTGQIAAALRLLGFDQVYDTSFTADLTVIEEANEFVKRKNSGDNLPLMTSCCPGWVKYVEQYHPEHLANLSTCKSPQQMFGSVAKDLLPKEFGTTREDLVVVSIMPCTAKKFEAKRPEFYTDNVADVDHVITTQELASMIKQAGINFKDLDPEPLDMPFGFKSGAGVLFGNTGGVSEAVLRYLYEKIKGVQLESVYFHEARGLKGVKEVCVNLNGADVNIAIVNGLSNIKHVLKEMKEGKKHYDFIEVMSCPGGCIGGAGQPVCYDTAVKESRAEGIYNSDKMLKVRKAQENPYINELYETRLGEIGGKSAHDLLHTHYHNRKRIADEQLALLNDPNSNTLEIGVCIGTNCFIKGSQKLLSKLMNYVEEKGIAEKVNLHANFCMESCEHGPSVTVGNNKITHCTFEMAVEAIEKALV